MQPLLELRDLIDRRTGNSGLGTNATAIPDLSLVRQTTPSEPIAHSIQPSLAVVAQGQKKVVLGRREFAYGAGQFLVVTVDLPISSYIVSASEDEPFFAAIVVLQPAAIASLLLETTGREDRPATLAGLAVSNAPQDLLEPAVRLLRLLDDPQSVPVLLPGIERELLWRLLNGDQGPLVRQIGLADSRLSQISRAIRSIRAHYDETLRIEDLAEQVGMSLSTFHRHFRAVTALTPIQYQKQIRLQEARARLAASADDVAAIGFEVGYDSPSQFSREYRRFFGSSPGRDAMRLRGEP